MKQKSLQAGGTMKFRILLTAFLCGWSAPKVQAQWVAQSSNTTSNLYDIKFLDANTGIAVGSGGTILKTTNGGDNWIIKATGILPAFNSLCFINSTVGFASTSANILKTTDRGETWVQQTSTPPWTQVNPQSGGQYSILRVSCVDTNTIYAQAKQTYTISLMEGPISQRILVRSTDGGNTWTAIADRGMGGNAVFYVNANEAFGVSGTAPTPPAIIRTGGVYRTSNLGASQIELKTGNHFLYALRYFPAEDILFVAGTVFSGGGTGPGLAAIYKTANQSSPWISSVLPLYDTLYSIQGVTPTTLWVAGKKGAILKTTDGGTTWGNQLSEPTSPLRALVFLDENTGWAVGDGGVILKTTNGGGPITPVALHSRGATAHDFRADHTKVHYSLSTAGHVQAKVFNGRGALLLNLLDQTMPAGDHLLDLTGMQLPPGAHFLDLRTPAYRESVQLPAR